jgi:serine/threonine protein kinase
MDIILVKGEHRIFGHLVCLINFLEKINLSFSLGVLLFEMVYGYRPFEHVRDNYDKMSHIARLTQNPIIPPTSNFYLRDVIQQCLQIDPIYRPNAQELLQHPFFDF